MFAVCSPVHLVSIQVQSSSDQWYRSWRSNGGLQISSRVEKTAHGLSPDGLITMRPDVSLVSVPADGLADHHLVFWTSTSDTFIFGDETTQSSDRLQVSKSPPLRRAIGDLDFEWAGTIILDEAGPDWLELAKPEVILVGEVQYSRLDDEPRDTEDCPSYPCYAA